MYKLKDEYKEVLYIKRTITDEEFEDLKTMISDEVEMYEPDVDKEESDVDTTYPH